MHSTPPEKGRSLGPGPTRPRPPPTPRVQQGGTASTEPPHTWTPDWASALDLRERIRIGFNVYFLGWSLLLSSLKNWRGIRNTLSWRICRERPKMVSGRGAGGRAQVWTLSVVWVRRDALCPPGAASPSSPSAQGRDTASRVFHKPPGTGAQARPKGTRVACPFAGGLAADKIMLLWHFS